MIWKHGRFRVEEFPLANRLTLPAGASVRDTVVFGIPQELAGARFDVGFTLVREGYTNWFNGKSLPTEVRP